MSLNTAQLWQAIQENGLANAADCRDWASQIVETSGASSLNDPQLLLAQLVKLKKITPFQANAFLSNSSQTLTIGRHRLLAPLTSPALTNWFEAIDPTSNASRWIYAIPAGHLQSELLLRHPPSLLYSKKQASVKGESLQSMSPPAMIDGYLIVAATPAPGKPLRDELKNYRHNILPNDKAMKIIYSLSIALADMHEQGVVHGRIGIDQIWWDGSAQVTLLRDPFFPPVSPLTMDVPVAVGVAADQDFRIRYAAPEFTAPAQQPTPATDMYALGCLWWELLTGRLPFWDTMLDKVPTSACMFPLAIPQNTGLSQGQSKCLEFLLAKTPSSRFQNGGDFVNALKVVVPREWTKQDSPAAQITLKPNGQNAASELSAPVSIVTNPVIAAVTDLTAKPQPFAKNDLTAKSDLTVNASQPAKSEVNTKANDSVKSDLTAKTIRPPVVEKLNDAPESSGSQQKVVSGNEPKKQSKESKESNVSNDSTRVVTSKHDQVIASKRAEATKEAKASPVSPSPIVSQAPVVSVSSTQVSSEPVLVSQSLDSTPSAPSKAIPSAATPTLATAPVAILPVAPQRVASKGATSKSPSRKKKQKPVWFLPSMIGGSVVLLGFLAWMLSGATSRSKTITKNVEPNQDKIVASDLASTSDSSTISTEQGQQTRSPVKPREVDPLTEQFLIATTENSFPWLPPRASKPYSLEMLPPGIQGLLVLRPATWIDSESGFALNGGLSKPIELLWDPIRKSIGATVADIQQVALGLYSSSRDDGFPDWVYRISLVNPTKVSLLKQNWGNFEEQPVGEKNHLWSNGSFAIFTHPGPVDDDREISQFTWGPLGLIRDLAEVDGKASAITRSLEDLWQTSDSQSDLSLLVSTNFLFSSSRSLLPAINPRLSESLQGLLAEKTLGLAFTTSLTNSWYGELRMLGRESAESAKLLEEFRSLAKDLSTSTESSLVQTPAHEYWRALSIRYPQMLRALDKHLRFGLENGQLVMNFYLPKPAASNLAIASWLMLQPSSFQAASGSSSGPSKSANQTTPPSFALLEHPITISFEQEPLDSALALLTEELNSSLPPNVPKVLISIDGKAFELSSVTRNQQIRDFRFKGAPLRKLLTDLASRVNPDKTITTVKDQKQAVVWIVEGKGESQEIVFTTRRGIEGSKKELPNEFSAP